MELRAYLKQDITDFFDRKDVQERKNKETLRPEEVNALSTSRDYAKEVREAIQKGNLIQAKAVWYQLVNECKQAIGMPSEERFQAILCEVDSILKKGLAEKQVIDAEVASFDPQHPEAPLVAPTSTTPAPATPAGATPEQEQALESQTQAVTQAVLADDLKGAINAYTRLKELFDAYPSEPHDRKKAWYENIINSYAHIKTLQERHKARHETGIKQREEESQKSALEERRLQARTTTIQDAKDAVKEAIMSLDTNDAHAMVQKLMEARHRVAKLPADAAEEKKALAHILSTITHKIQAQRHDQQMQQIQQKREESKGQEPASSTTAVAPVPTPPETATNPPAADKTKTFLPRKGMTAEQIYQEGLRHQHGGDHLTARELYLQVLNISPNHLPSRIRLEQLDEQAGMEAQNHANA